eukprot:6213152-Pleurochrysis_carterae.AAC.2
MVKIKDDLNGDQYGIYNSNSLHQLRISASGHGITIGTLWNTSEWDLDTEFTKTSTWGTKAPKNHTPAIRGAQHKVYPPNEGWITTQQHLIRLSGLTIKRMTTLFTTNTGRPSCQRKWEQILPINVDWKKMWRTLSNSFSNPYDSKTWFKLSHRALRLNGNDRAINSNKCRLCEHIRESHAHFLTCNKLNDTRRRLVLQLLSATGMDLDTFFSPYTWLTCLDKHNQPLNEVQVALVTIHWNILYKHMTKQKLDNKTFDDTAAMKDYARAVSHRILALTKKLSLHNQTRQHGSNATQSVSTSMANILHTIGQYNPHSGSFYVNNNIKRLLTIQDPLLFFPAVEPSLEPVTIAHSPRLSHLCLCMSQSLSVREGGAVGGSRRHLIDLLLLRRLLR